CPRSKSISFSSIDTPLDKEAETKTEKAAPNTVPNIPVTDFANNLSTIIKKLIVQANTVNSTAFEGNIEGKRTFIRSRTKIALLTFSRNHLGSGPVQEERSKLKAK
ncbi:hypothetical protein QBC43DRAFT_334934, partial [Cladorrhinum sp. PSN259]